MFLSLKYNAKSSEKFGRIRINPPLETLSSLQLIRFLSSWTSSYPSDGVNSSAGIDLYNFENFLSDEKLKFSKISTTLSPTLSQATITKFLVSLSKLA